MRNCAWCVLGLIACVAAPHSWATPANKAALSRHFDRFLAKRLDACTTCHLPSDKKDPQSLDEFPHNRFGAALAAMGKQLKKEGKKRDIATRLELLASQDSDGDGVDNLTELLLGHNPGDPKDAPTAAELKEAGERREEFAAFLKSYRFQPFEPVTRPAVPAIANVTNPLDAFVGEQLAVHHLHASPEAPKVVLLRRVYLDLIGLNPTPQEIADYEADGSPDAYERVVDRLLADPRYGQRWARHWMDVWRYSDWAGWSGGNQIRDSQPFIWRWRDWIVESLNADKGYDRMLVEMLAADELCPDDASALRATGFLVRNFKMLSREQWLEDTVNHTSRALLGLTMHCAKCHDHKFDPITQEEYYHLRAIFEPHNVRTDPVPGSTDKKQNGLVRAYDKDLAAETLFFIRGDERTPDKARGALSPGVPAVLGGALAAQPVELPFGAAHPDRQAFVRRDLIAEAEKALADVKVKLEPVKNDAKLGQRQRSEAEATIAVAQAKRDAVAAMMRAEEIEDAGRKDSVDWQSAARETVAAQRRLAVAESSLALISGQNATDDARQRIDALNKATTKPLDPKLLAKANADLDAAQKRIEPAQKSLSAALAAMNEPPGVNYKPRAMDDYPATSTGRRLAFARWLTDAKNPLAARVAVNHIWARHFAQGLVPSVDDFGRNGRGATHPALLDWLAAELMHDGWEMKPVHRLIVTSRTYRQSSLPDVEEVAADPDDTWLWRFPSRRMEAELVRDNILYSSGQLDLALGGPEIDHTQGLASHRRSLYLQVAPEKEVEFLKIFDGPNPNECYVRRPSVMPQQALALANSQVVVEQAHALAGTLAKKYSEPDDYISAAFRRVLARPATPEERTACRAFLAESKVAAERAREDLIVVLFNHNDFVTIR